MGVGPAGSHLRRVRTALTRGITVVSEWGIVNRMAMTLRLTDADTEALRAQAQIEGRSMQDVARGAVRRYIEQYAHRGRVAASSAEGAQRYAEALRILGE